MARYVKLLGSYVGSNDRALRGRPGRWHSKPPPVPRMAKFKLPDKKGADVGVELVRKDEAAEQAREATTPE